MKKKRKNEAWSDYDARTCRKDKKRTVKMGLHFLYEVIAESMWRARGWICDDRPNAVADTLKQVISWRCTKWWQSTQASGMKNDPSNHTKWWWHCSQIPFSTHLSVNCSTVAKNFARTLPDPLSLMEVFGAK